MKLQNKQHGTRGCATGTGGFANTRHLTRVLTYLSEALGPSSKTDIGRACDMSLSYTNDALNFLVGKKMIRKFHFSILEARARGINTYKAGGAIVYELNGKLYAQQIIDSI